jgi:hypothetical protein
MSNTIYLYLKTHQITGLKYLGKTENDPYSYKGSGVYWKNHIKKHGNNVTTEVIYNTTDKKEFERVALEYSRKLNIVESTEFANLIEESGQGGITTNQFKRGNIPWNKGRTDVDTTLLQAGRQKYHDDWQLHNVKKKRVHYWSPPSDNVSSLNKKSVQCPHCSKTGNVGNMNRWHFDNCKMIGN